MYKQMWESISDDRTHVSGTSKAVRSDRMFMQSKLRMLRWSVFAFQMDGTL